MHNLRVLLYTVAFDRPEGPAMYRAMAKMLVSGLLRNFFDGRIVVFRNTPQPLFKVERKGLDEIYVDLPTDGPGAQEFKYVARRYLDPADYGAVAFVDADCAALRGVEHLFPDEPWDILWQPESAYSVTSMFHNALLTDGEMNRLMARPGANSGTWAVRAEHYEAVMEEWERLDTAVPCIKPGADQAAWNRLLLDTPLRTRKLERDEIVIPPQGGNYCDWREAALVHVAGWPLDARVEFLAGLYYAATSATPAGITSTSSNHDPRNGISPDGVHQSRPPRGPAQRGGVSISATGPARAPSSRREGRMAEGCPRLRKPPALCLRPLAVPSPASGPAGGSADAAVVGRRLRAAPGFPQPHGTTDATGGLGDFLLRVSAPGAPGTGGKGSRPGAERTRYPCVRGAGAVL